MSSKQKVIVGMSGGVDSSVSAYLLKEQGYHVEGLFMKNWEEDDTDEYCSAAVDLADAQSVCDKLGIELHTVNFSAEYWDRVFEYFLQEYKAGRTPNPDIMCNKEIKFKAFLEFAMHLGADYIATGHYTRNRKVENEYQLMRGLDGNKDQSYFLYTLGQLPLSKTLFPVGELEKSDVRRIAEENDLVTANKKDSTGICFIGERKFKDFLEKFIPAQPGPIIKDNGEQIGEHQGLMFHTLGQRKGLGIGGKKDAPEEPWYVVAKQVEENTLVVGQGHGHPLLMSEGLICSQMDWVSNILPTAPLTCTAKVRYRQKDFSCQLSQIDDEHWKVSFTGLQRAVTPGQSVVFYDHDVCLGGAIIESIIQ